MRNLLDGRLRLEHRGTDLGDVHPRHPGAVQRILEAARPLDLDDVVWLRLDFTNRVARTGDVIPFEPGLGCTQITADGFLLNRRRRGVLISNADCACGVLASADRAVVLHLGLACLWREDGQPTVMERAIDALGVPVSELSFWIGAAIGPCCHGYALKEPREQARQDALMATFGPDVCPGPVRHGPRKGFAACDHALIGARLAAQLGVPRIDIERTCTSCAGMADPDGPGYGSFYSNTRDSSGTRERNLVLVALA